MRIFVVEILIGIFLMIFSFIRFCFGSEAIEKKLSKKYYKDSINKYQLGTGIVLFFMGALYIYIIIKEKFIERGNFILNYILGTLFFLLVIGLLLLRLIVLKRIPKDKMMEREEGKESDEFL